MAHHGSGPLDGVPDDPEREEGRRKRLSAMLDSVASFRGALGEFPEGKLTKTDEGSIQFAVGIRDGKVILDFGTPVHWVGMSAQQAADLASLLLVRAREAGRLSGDVVTLTIGGGR